MGLMSVFLCNGMQNCNGVPAMVLLFMNIIGNEMVVIGASSRNFLLFFNIFSRLVIKLFKTNSKYILCHNAL